MKQLYLLLLALFVVGIVHAQNWTPQISGIALTLNSVCFPKPDTGYVVGDHGTLLKTTNGGVNWTLLPPPMAQSYWLGSVFFTDAGKGWTTGENGVIFKTSNGGNDWDIGVQGGWVFMLNSICFPDANTGYAVGATTAGGGGTLEKTTDGGLLWSDPNGINANSLESVYFTDIITGYSVGDHGTIIKTTDGGLSWVTQVSGTSRHLYSVYFTDQNTGYAVGDSGIILKTSNGGSDWISRPSGTGKLLKSVYFAGMNVGYAVGYSGTILNTMNGGNDWSIEYSGTPKNLHSVFFTDPNTGYAVGESGLILKTTNGGGVGVAENFSVQAALEIYPNPAQGIITVESSKFSGNAQLSISNMKGQEMMSCKVSDRITQIDIGEFPSGVYFLRLIDEKSVQTRKIVKE